MYTFLKEEKKRNEKMLIPVGVEKDKKTYKLLTIENTNEILANTNASHVMYNMINKINTTMHYTWKLLRG